MLEPKPIHREAVPAALAKAERYRLLNQPRQAESICLDVLRIEPANQQALTTLLLALTDQFAGGYGVDIRAPREVLGRLTGEYERTYYDAVIRERWAKGLLRGGSPREAVAGWLHEAMKLFEAAQAASPPGNDDAVLRWNACARLLNRMESERGPAASAGTSPFPDEYPLD